MQSNTFLEKPVGRVSRQQEEDFRCCTISSKVLWLMGSNCVMVTELFLNGCKDNADCTQHGAPDSLSNFQSFVSKE